MSRHFSYLNTALEILKEYDGSEPFASSIKKYFSGKKKHGSRDRKEISQLCYSYFRLGKAALDLPTEERLMLALFLCSGKENEMMNKLRPEWNDKLSWSVQKKVDHFKDQFYIKDIFPFTDELSTGLDAEPFILSHFIQPNLFLRIRPGRQKMVLEKLVEANIQYDLITPLCIALSNSTPVEKLVALNREAVVQDYNSQQVSTFFPSGSSEKSFSVWDCCAGSGGKSLLVYDHNPAVDLTVSDIRETILLNLKKRFREAGIHRYRSFLADLSQDMPLPVQTFFDMVICDVPCSGSGTWSRTPEQLFYFERDRIEDFSSRQKKIATRAARLVKPGGFLLYITCSVFMKENEEVVSFICDSTGFEIIRMECLKGYDRQADSLFAALLQKTS